MVVYLLNRITHSLDFEKIHQSERSFQQWQTIFLNCYFCNFHFRVSKLQKKNLHENTSWVKWLAQVSWRANLGHWGWQSASWAAVQRSEKNSRGRAPNDTKWNQHPKQWRIHCIVLFFFLRCFTGSSSLTKKTQSLKKSPKRWLRFFEFLTSHDGFKWRTVY